MTRRAVILDVDGTLLDVLRNLRAVWREWASRHALDEDEVWRTALVSRPVETFAAVAPSLDPGSCLAVLHELEDEDARTGAYTAFDGAGELLHALRPSEWGIVTGNYAHRVHIRFDRLGLPLPPVLIDADAVRSGKPDPEGYLKAAGALGRRPEDCLVLEDGESGIAAGLAAGMTVWAVNVTPDQPGVERAQRAYPRLNLAVADIREWLDGGQR